MYVALLDSEGYPNRLGALKKVASFAGIHTNVLRRWWRKTQNPPPTDLVTQKKADLSLRLRDLAHLVLDTLPDAIDEADARELFTGLGITLDKLQLLEGKPTEHIQHDISDDERSARVATLLDAARTRRDGSVADD